MGGLIGYARCSAVLQVLTAQREILTGLGVAADRIYLDKGFTGTSRARPCLDQAVRAVDTLVVRKLDRLARSVPDALLKMRTREGMAIARSRGRPKGKKPKLTARQQAELVRMHATGGYTIADLMEVFSVGRATVYRVMGRAATSAPGPDAVPGPSPNTPA